MEMTQGFIAPLPTFTLESLVASRQWSAEQRYGRKKVNPAKTGKKDSRDAADNGGTRARAATPLPL
jgi:hypothetical protein